MKSKASEIGVFVGFDAFRYVNAKYHADIISMIGTSVPEEDRINDFRETVEEEMRHQ